VTFEKIAPTGGFAYVNKVVSHPTKNVVFASTNTGLRVSTEGNDEQWTLVLGGNARDFVIDKNGNALAYTNKRYIDLKTQRRMEVTALSQAFLWEVLIESHLVFLNLTLITLMWLLLVQ